MSMHGFFGGGRGPIFYRIDNCDMLINDDFKRRRLGQRQIPDPIHLCLQTVEHAPGIFTINACRNCLMELLVKPQEAGMIFSCRSNALLLDEITQVFRSQRL